MKVVIRADSSPRIGAGHVFRCLALGAALKQSGADVTFASAAMPQNLARAIAAQGIAIDKLPVAEPAGHEAPSPADEQIADAEATIEMATGADWIVVDSYALAKPFEDRIRAAGHRLLAIDDIGRTHDCELLLDQTLHRQAEARYSTSTVGLKLLGPRYALLRPEFAAARAGVDVRRNSVGRLFVMMSGSDPDDSCNMVLNAIEQAGAHGMAADIVAGSGHPALQRLEVRAAKNPNWNLYVDSDCVAQLMAKADIAIGAGGSATWERACLGLPSVAICLAANQSELLREAAATGLMLAVPPPHNEKQIASALKILLADDGLRLKMSARGLALVDGHGARRVASAMRSMLTKVRPAIADDCEKLLQWRNAPHVRAVSRSSDEILLTDHIAWFQRTLAANDRWLLIGTVEGEETGVVRFDRIQTGVAEVSIYMAPAARRGDGSSLLAAAEMWLADSQPDIHAVQAEYRADNSPSHALFSNAGYAVLSGAGYAPQTMTTQKRLRPEKASG